MLQPAIRRFTHSNRIRFQSCISHLAFLAVGGTIATSVVPVRAVAQSFPDALAGAYNTNPQLLAERAALRALDENVPQALANWRPTVTVSSSVGYDHISSEGSANSSSSASSLPSTLQGSTPSVAAGTSENLHPDVYGLSITQPLFRGGRTAAQTEQALNQIRSERAHLLSIEQGVLLQAVTDYVDVLLYQADLDLNLNNEQVLRRQLEAVRDRFEVGEVTRTDVSQAEASYAQAIASRQQAQGNLQVSRATFQRDVGVTPTKLQPPIQVPVLPTSRDEAISVATQANPDVVSAQFTQQAAEDNIRLVRGQLLPTISLNAGIQHLDNSFASGISENEKTVTAQLSMPLYEGGAVYSQSRQAQQTASQRQNQVDQARRSSIQSAAAAWEQLATVRAEIVSFKQQIDANGVALEGVQLEAAVGERTVLDILNAEQTLFQSRVSLVQSQHDEVVAKFTLAQSLGRLTAKNLGLPVQFYDPDKNFEAVRDKWIGFGTDE